ncbi:hypothetical protein EAH89_10210 [Roseomonas nepalensis]|uniref:Dienelactone hydrolase domain-containing protein n=1 Tax=Muricoccus nepalensis TaxID=1854500 RepID=A0A502G7E2_9PROT|nr:hypothetical protein EAH89_10210 [Roseomonas nepalensis]
MTSAGPRRSRRAPSGGVERCRLLQRLRKACEHTASRDKSIAFVEGATHGFTPCEPCARAPGQSGDTMARSFDHVAAWIAARFVPGTASLGRVP